jgi:hypothetical protein
VYISRQFRSVLAELRIKELHHKPYCAFAKGKVEAMQKTIKNEFQSEAARAGIRTVEELNTAFWAWAEIAYNTRTHSSTGQTPDERFLQGLPGDHRRVEDLERFQAMFLWKLTRTVTKWGKVSLSRVLIYDLSSTIPLETTTTMKQVTRHAPHIPQESQTTARQISAQSVAYFTALRQRYREAQKNAQEVSFQSLRRTKEDGDE